jgi:hypothetical protein
MNAGFNSIVPSFATYTGTDGGDSARHARRSILQQMLHLIEDAWDLGEQLAINPMSDALYDAFEARINAQWDDPAHQQMDFWRQ